MRLRYVERDREELEKLKSERRPGRPASSRQDALQRKMDLERNEFKTGYSKLYGVILKFCLYICHSNSFFLFIDLPDLTDKENVERLLKWDGGIGGIIQVNMIRVTEKPSADIQKTDTEMQE
jgi:translation machinery-associated protein 16